MGRFSSRERLESWRMASHPRLKPMRSWIKTIIGHMKIEVMANGLVHVCREPGHFEALEAFGFKRNKTIRNNIPVVEAWIQSGIPAKAVKAGLYEFPDVFGDGENGKFERA
jgi:hypothetical protein